jgi:SAM-dependent methyltransferase
MAARFAAIHDHVVAPTRSSPGRALARRRHRHRRGGAACGARRSAGKRLDLAPVMIETARRRAAEQGLAIRFEVGDAESLPNADASFDVVASALEGLPRARPRRGRPRARARLPPGGRLGVVAWRPDPEAERMHAPFWPARERGAGDRRDWGREEYVAGLLEQEFELEFERG